MNTERDAIRVFVWLLLFEAILVAVYLLTAVIAPVVSLEPALAAVFDVNEELSLATWFSVVQLFMVGIVLFGAANLARTVSRPIVKTLAFAGVGFVLLSADEGVMIHEKLTAAMRMVGLTDLLIRGEKGGWIVVYTALALAFIVVFRHGLGHVWRQFRGPSQLAILGSTMFVGGGVGVEVLRYLTESRDDTVIAVVRTAVEELLEMVGVSVLLLAAVLLLLRINARAQAQGLPGSGSETTDEDPSPAGLEHDRSTAGAAS